MATVSTVSTWCPDTKIWHVNSEACDKGFFENFWSRSSFLSTCGSSFNGTKMTGVVLVIYHSCTWFECEWRYESLFVYVLELRLRIQISESGLQSFMGWIWKSHDVRVVTSCTLGIFEVTSSSIWGSKPAEKAMAPELSTGGGHQRCWMLIYMAPEVWPPEEWEPEKTRIFGSAWHWAIFGISVTPWRVGFKILRLSEARHD